jgi:FkbM family methyltransferase
MFEPVRELVDYLKGNYKNDSFIVRDFGLGGYDRTAPINLVGKTLDGSTFLEDISAVGVCLAFIRDIVNYIMVERIDKIDLLKLNVEGLEYEILERLIDSNAIKNIKFIQVQFHNFADNSIVRRDNIRSFLSKTHEEMYNFPFVWESWQKT